MLTRVGLVCVALIVSTCAASKSLADIVANDDASKSDYDSGWSNGNNGGSGFGAWQFNNSGSGGEFIATFGGNNALSIGSGEYLRAFALTASGDSSSTAVRPFVSDLHIGDTFSIDMDNQAVSDSSKVGFSLRNSASGGTDLASFYLFGPIDSNSYMLGASGVSGSTPIGTAEGLRLSFTLFTTKSFTFTIDGLANGLGVDYTLTGNLLVDLPVNEVRLYNLHAGSAGPQNVYFNNLSISAVPEVSPLAAVPLAIAVVAGVSGIWRRWKNKRQFAAR